MKKTFYLSTLCFALLACGNTNQQQTATENPDSETPKDTLAMNENETNTTKEAGLPISAFVKDGYEILNETKGDLNKDAFEDVILVLKKSDEDQLYADNGEVSKRILIILTNVDGNSYNKLAENENTVLTIADGGAMGDPFSGIAIKDGYFTVEHMGGAAERWTRFITFKYAKEDNQFYLHKDITEGFDTDNPDKVLYNHTKTTKDFGQVKFEDFNNDK